MNFIRNRISHDLHDDIGSTLGSISIYSEVAKHADESNRNEVLEKIGASSREMLEKLNDIVWSINPENDHLDRMESRMRSFALMLLQPLGISYSFKFNTDGHRNILTMDQRRNVFLIYKEALHNIAKYASCKNVTIQFEVKDSRIRMEITDDGIGFQQNDATANNGNGMKSMRLRAQALKAGFDVITSPGSGTKIKISQW